MKTFILFCAFFPALTFAAGKAPDSYCAKIYLSAIYSAEKAYHSEYEAYNDSFEAIGFEQTDPKCNEWQLDVRVVGAGQEFIATAKHPAGEEWTINEKKILLREHRAD